MPSAHKMIKRALKMVQQFAEAATKEVLYEKKMFLNFSQNSQENICTRVY